MRVGVARTAWSGASLPPRGELERAERGTETSPEPREVWAIVRNLALITPTRDAPSEWSDDDSHAPDTAAHATPLPPMRSIRFIAVATATLAAACAAALPSRAATAGCGVD